MLAPLQDVLLTSRIPQQRPLLQSTFSVLTLPLIRAIVRTYVPFSHYTNHERQSGYSQSEKSLAQEHFPLFFTSTISQIIGKREIKVRGNLVILPSFPLGLRRYQRIYLFIIFATFEIGNINIEVLMSNAEIQKRLDHRSGHG